MEIKKQILSIFQVGSYSFETEKDAKKYIAEKEKGESIISENLRRLREVGYKPVPVLIDDELDLFTEFEYESESLRGEQIRYLKKEVEILSPERALEIFVEFGISICAGKLEELVEGLIFLNDVLPQAKVSWRNLMRALGQVQIYPDTIYLD